MTRGKVELLSPAGDFETALSAFDAGADAVYCGLADFSARAFAKNFTLEELEQLMAYARRFGKRVYVTFNTLLDEDALEGAAETLARLEAIGPDALIVQDLGVASMCRRHFPKLALHASTQLVAHNLEGVLAMGELGFTRVVLARELSLAEISSIAKRCGKLELECFIHGALCYSISGLCLYSAMEKGRSGNRGKCAYCCRLAHDDGNGGKTLPFSMKDLRLGEDAVKLADAGVASLKIEGRMKSPIYVASVTRYYRDILDGNRPRVTTRDLETVFSRRTTELYLNGGRGEDVIDPESLGHLGTEIGIVKKITKDRDGLSWLRFHTSRGLEKHDGLQFEATDEKGKHLGIGIKEMRQAISRRPVYEVNAGTDVEVLVEGEVEAALRPGMKIYCSMSNAVKRLFPLPSFRPSDYEGGVVLDVEVTIASESITANDVSIKGKFERAKSPEKTAEGVRKAFSKLGGTAYRLGELKVNDPEGLFVPMSVLNDLRRDLVERMDDAREKALSAKIAAARNDEAAGNASPDRVRRRLKLRLGQRLPAGDWDEIILSVNDQTDSADIFALGLDADRLRLALPVYTAEPDFNRLRNAIKGLLRAGFDKWEASDLATLRTLKALGVSDITADWTLYAFNSMALRELSELGVRRFVASPENTRENLQYLAESGYAVEFLSQQSTPLFISKTKPGEQNDLAVHELNGLWITTKRVPRTFDLPANVSTRLDLSWAAVE